MRKKMLAVAALTTFIGIVPTFAQEQPSTTPAPEAEQPPAAATDKSKTDTAKKVEPTAHPRLVRHYGHGRYYWPWDWAWAQWRYELHRLQRHRT
jgi:hypothetical protein